MSEPAGVFLRVFSKEKPMNHWKKIIMRILNPGRGISALLVLLGFGLLGAVFYYSASMAWFAYPVYVLAFYSLILLISGSIPVFQKISASVTSLSDRFPVQLRTSLIFSLTINLCYAAFHFLSGVLQHSVWMLSVGGYHLILSIIRIVLVFYEVKQAKATTWQEAQVIGWKGFRNCGVLLLLLNLAMTGMVFQMIWHEQSSSYSELMIYAVAAYTFYKIIASVIRVVQGRKINNPVNGAARNISLSAAMVSMYSLQAAMISTFHGGSNFQHLMNSLTGAAVCLLVVFGSLGMTIHGNNRAHAPVHDSK